jgi:hypothetical protein
MPKRERNQTQPTKEPPTTRKTKTKTTNNAQQHVGQLLADVRPVGLCKVWQPRLYLAAPLEHLGQLAHLAGQRQKQVAGCMVAAPLSFLGKRGDTRTHLLQRQLFL